MARSAPRDLASLAISRMRAELPSKSPTVGLNWARASFIAAQPKIAREKGFASCGAKLEISRDAVQRASQKRNRQKKSSRRDVTPGAHEEPIAHDLSEQNLGAERTAAAAGALDVRVIELKARTVNRFDVIDLNAVEVHLAHLIDQHFQALEFIDVVAIFVHLIFKGHVVAKTG